MKSILEISQEILAMRDRDQAMRKSGIWNGSVDQENTERMKEIVSEMGWPVISLVGKDVSDAAWLLVQHADHDVLFQEKCLQLMKSKNNDVVPKNVAYLEDRVLVNKNLPQKYGTQFGYDEQKNLVPRPIENVDHIDELRAQVGLEPFEEYKKAFLEKHS